MGYVILKGLFDVSAIKKYKTAMARAITARDNNSSWHTIQGDSKRQYREMGQFPFMHEGMEMIKRIKSASCGIIHNKLTLVHAMLLRSLDQNEKQGSHIDAANETNRGCSVIISIMPSTYMISYMNNSEIDINLDIGDVLIFGNGFKHGGGKYNVHAIPSEHKMLLDLHMPAHYRAFLSYEHQDDSAKSKRVTFKQK
jgi:hypothetical protein